MAAAQWAGAQPQPSPPPPQQPRQAVEVTRERIVAPPERFIAVGDDSLLQHFQGELPVDAQGWSDEGFATAPSPGCPSTSPCSLLCPQARCPWTPASWPPCLPCLR